MKYFLTLILILLLPACERKALNSQLMFAKYINYPIPKSVSHLKIKALPGLGTLRFVLAFKIKDSDLKLIISEGFEIFDDYSKAPESLVGTDPLRFKEFLTRFNVSDQISFPKQRITREYIRIVRNVEDPEYTTRVNLYVSENFDYACGFVIVASNDSAYPEKTEQDAAANP